MEDDSSLDNLQKGLLDNEMESEELPVLNDNSNGHLDSEFNSVDASAVDESSTSNVFLNTVELSTGSAGDFNERNTEEFNAESFEVGDNAVTFPSDSMNNIFSDGDSRLSDTGYKHSDTDGDASQKLNINNDFELSNDNSMTVEDNSNAALITDNVENTNGSEDFITNDKEQAMDTDTECATVKQKIEQVEQTTVEGEPDEPKESESLDAANEDNEAGIDKIVAGKDDNVAGIDENMAGIDENVAEIMPGDSDNEAGIEENEAGKDKNVAGNEDDEVKNIAELGGAEETEVVSEDELPTVEKPKIKDAENVSDDELPGPRPADMPADTEVVSEDELPASKKESRKRKPDAAEDGYDPGSPTSETEAATKKQAVAKNGESKPISAEKRSSTDEKPKKKALPELDKYWKVVNDDPSDFTGWTYLLQYVDQESDVEAAREAYDAFLSHYPYCYGYWRKYADYEKRKGSKKKCFEVLERGLKAIPLSVDLWIHYLNHIKTTKSDDHAFIKSQYERAIDTCGLEFRSDRLWESYIKWEAENGTPLNVTAIYDKLLATPTLGYTSHFDNFQEHVMGEPVGGVVSREELVRLRAEVRESAGGAPPLDLPPGEDEPPDHVASEEEGQAIKERVIAARRKVHKATGEEIAARWTFEEGIKRPYFHVKPLERCQLKNWKSYLEWEKTHGSLKRALVLHERCLIACALYEEFWVRLVKFLEERSGAHPELVGVEREVLERACTVHHLDKPELHLHWAHFEEAQGNAPKAAEILDRIEKTCPSIVHIQYRRVNLERRRGEYEKCCQLYESYIASAKNKAVASAHAIKYARFLYHVRGDRPAARKVLDDAIAKEPLNQRLHLQRLDLALHTPGTPYEELEELVSSYERQEGAETEACALMACRRRELAEELGGAAAARAAHHHARALAKNLRKRARKDKQDAPPTNPTAEASKKKEGAASTAPATVANTTYYQTPPAAAPAYDQAYQQQYQPPWGYQQPPAPYQHPPHWPPQYTNYY